MRFRLMLIGCLGVVVSAMASDPVAEPVAVLVGAGNAYLAELENNPAIKFVTGRHENGDYTEQELLDIAAALATGQSVDLTRGADLEAVRALYGEGNHLRAYRIVRTLTNLNPVLPDYQLYLGRVATKLGLESCRQQESWKEGVDYLNDGFKAYSYVLGLIQSGKIDRSVLTAADLLDSFRNRVTCGRHDVALEIGAALSQNTLLTAMELLEVGEYLWMRGRYSGDFKACAMTSLLADKKVLSQLSEASNLDFALYAAYGRNEIQAVKWLRRLNADGNIVYRIFLAYIYDLLEKPQEVDRHLDVLRAAADDSWQPFSFLNEVKIRPALFKKDRAYIQAFFDRIKVLTGFYPAQIIRNAEMDTSAEAIMPELPELCVTGGEKIRQYISGCVDMAVLLDSRVAYQIVRLFGSSDDYLDLYRKLLVKAVGDHKVGLAAEPVRELWAEEWVEDMKPRFAKLKEQAFEDRTVDKELIRYLVQINVAIQKSLSPIGADIVQACGGLATRLGLAEILCNVASLSKGDKVQSIRRLALNVYDQVLAEVNTRDKLMIEEVAGLMRSPDSKPSQAQFKYLPIAAREMRYKGLLCVVGTLSGFNSTNKGLNAYVDMSREEVDKLWGQVYFKNIPLAQRELVLQLLQLSANPMNASDFMRYAALDVVLNNTTAHAKKIHQIALSLSEIMGWNSPKDFPAWIKQARKLLDADSITD